MTQNISKENQEIFSRIKILEQEFKTLQLKFLTIDTMLKLNDIELKKINKLVCDK